MPRYIVLECRQCNRQFINNNALQQHRQYSPAHNLKPYSCVSCNRSFKDESDLHTHTLARHTRYPCASCNRSFKHESALHSHTLAHHTYHCAPCNRSFKHESALHSHTLALHTRYPCASCNLSFEHESALHTHTLALHTRYRCTSCNRSFKHESALHSHTLALHTKIPCALCNRSFKHESALNDHTQAVHYRSSGFVSISASNKRNRMSSADDLRDAKCPFCPSYFVSPSAVAHHIESGCHGITRHQVTHTVKSLDIVPNICIAERIEGASPTPPNTLNYYIPSPNAFNGRAYACFLCQGMFRSLSSLSDHLNSAAHDANEFKCPKCKKRFKLISALIQHVESAACKLAGLQQVQNHFQGLIDQFSRLITC